MSRSSATHRSQVGRRGRALAALALAAVVGAALTAVFPRVRALEHATRVAVPDDALAWFWASLTLLFPTTAAARWDALAHVFAVGLATCAGWLGYQLFRGPGRIAAAFTASLLTSIAASSWVHATDVREQFPALPFAVLAVASVTALVRPLVHLGRLTPVAFARAVAAAGASAVVLPSAGVPLVFACLGVYLLRGRRIENLRGVPSDASLSRATMAGKLGVILIAGLAVPLLAALVLWPARAQLSQLGAWLVELRLVAPPVERLRPHLHPYLIYPALTLVVLLVLPLRWRGGLTLLVMLAGALTLGDASGPLATMPVLLAGLAVAVSGWVWLAGTVTARPHVGPALAVATSVGLIALVMPTRWSVAPSAETRPATTLARAFASAAASPGDVLLLHEATLIDELVAAQTEHGLRPDLVVIPAISSSDAELGITIDGARAEGRRVISDAYDLAGRGDPRDAIEAGPAYWYAFDHALALAQEVTELPEPAPGLDAREQARWTRMALERARFRRATGREPEAILALPLGEERRSLRTAIRVSQAINLPAQPGSELGGVENLERFPPGAPVVAEAGDLLFAAGEHALGLAMLTQAARTGYPPAWRALARWQLELGRLEAAERLRDEMANDPALRSAMFDVVWWLIWKQRTREAVAWRDHLAPAPEHAIEELALRLAVLTRGSRP